MNAEKTTQQLRKVIDDGIRFVSQGVGSNHALNIIKFLGRHNRRNPDQAILFLNHFGGDDGVHQRALLVLALPASTRMWT